MKPVARARAWGRALDDRLASRRPGILRTLLWAGTDYALLLVSAAAAFVLAALPPLSLLPSDQPLDLPDHVLLTWFYGSLGWPVHLWVVAAVSGTRRARLWVVLTTPLLSVAVFGLVYVLAVGSDTGRSAVLAYTLYGLVCRLHPR